MSTLRTLCNLTPGEKLNGTKCLRGSLNREIVTIDPEGNQRRYPVGTKLVLKKNKRGDYSLLAIVDHEPDPMNLYSQAVEDHGEPIPF